MSALNSDAAGVAEATTLQAASIAFLPPHRIHYLDNLRAMAMLLGVFLHSALAYAQPTQDFWVATDSTSSVAVDASFTFIHLFRMQLYFLLSGYFGKLIIERKGIWNFVWGRCLRIAAPFILFYPFLLAAMSMVIVFSLSYLDEPKGVMGLIAKAVEAPGMDRRPIPPGTMHLWFLYYLMFYTALGALLYNLKRLSPDAILRRPVLLFLSPFLLVPGAFAAGSPMPAPESFIPNWWPFAFYGLFYYAGWQLFGREILLDRMRPYTWRILAVSIVLFVPYYWLVPTLEISAFRVSAGQPNFGSRFVESCLTAYLSVLLTSAALLIGQRFLSSRSGLLSFVADSSYWTYLIHLPIVIFLQTLLIPLDLSLWLKLCAVVLGTLIACMTTYVVFVRYTPLGWLLHGKRSFP